MKARVDNSDNDQYQSWSQVLDLYQRVIDLDLSSEELDTQLSLYPIDVVQRVKKMLTYRNKYQTFFDNPLTKRVFEKESVKVEKLIGSKIGDFKLVKLIASGGMGFVFRAVKSSPVHMTVAIKILKNNLDNDLMVWFKLEQKNLVKLNHPNIASVYDVGVNSEGVPYIIMEEVDGIPITEYANKNRLSIAERINLVRSVCKAIQYSHQRGVIHCDLKSSNILVRKIENEPIIKIIDFGLSSLSSDSGIREKNKLIGTPEYMGPEYTNLEKEIDVRADIFALGSLLYSMMIGELPFSRDKLVSDDLTETFENIKNKTVSSLHVKFKNQSTDRQKLQAFYCNSKLSILHKFVKTDINKICLKSLQKKRQNRYQSIEEFDRDILLFLSGMPLSGMKYKWYEHFSKFIIRNKYLSGMLITIGLVTAIVVGKIINQNELIKTQLQISEQQRKIATEQEQISNQVMALMIEIFESGDPYKLQDGQSVDIKEILKKGVKKVESQQISTSIRNKLLFNLSKVYTNLGWQDESISIINRIVNSVQLQDQNLYLELLFARTRNYLLSKEVGSALNSAKESLLYVESTTFGSENHAIALHELGKAYMISDDYSEAINFLKLADKYYSDNKDQVDILNRIQVKKDIGESFEQQQLFEEAEPYLRESYELADGIFDDNPLEYSEIEMTLASLLHQTNRNDEAIVLANNSASKIKEILGGDHPVTITNRANLASIYSSAGKFDLAIETQKENIKSAINYYGNNSIELIKHMTVLGNLYESNQDNANALQVRKAAFEKMNELQVENFHMKGITAFNYGLSLIALADNLEALKQLELSIEYFNQIYDSNHVILGIVLSEKLKVVMEMGDFNRALQIANETNDILKEQLDENNWRLLTTQAAIYYIEFQLGTREGQIERITEIHEKLLNLSDGHKRFADRVNNWIVDLKSASQ